MVERQVDVEVTGGGVDGGEEGSSHPQDIKESSLAVAFVCDVEGLIRSVFNADFQPEMLVMPPLKLQMAPNKLHDLRRWW